MRPIKKGAWPKDNNGNNLDFSDYTKAKPFLIERTGLYCHLCERNVQRSDLTIEHIQGQTLHPGKKGDWDNFLLSCRSCNSTKKEDVSSINNYFWPHIHYTLAIFESDLETGLVSYNMECITKDDYVNKAKGLIRIYGLDKTHNSDGTSHDSYIERLKAITIIKFKLERIKKRGNQLEEEDISEICMDAIRYGFFSVWLKVFENCPEVFSVLIKVPEFKFIN
jgi:HNH endonuclease